MLILLDMDGVLADFEAGFLNHWLRLHPDKDHVPIEARKSFYIDDDYPEAHRAIGKPPCDEGAILHGPEGSALRAGGTSAGRWSPPSSARAWPSSTARSSTSRCRRLQRELNASAFEAQWVIEAYALFLASLLLVGGALGDRFGRRRVFMIGVGLFTAASVLCGLSRTVGQLIAARSVQGIGAALLVPGSLALLSATFPQASAARDRHLVGVQRHHRGDRAGARRLPRRPLLVGLGLSGQRAARRAADDHLRGQGPGEPRRSLRTATSTWRARCSRRWAWPASSSRSSKRRAAAGARPRAGLGPGGVAAWRCSSASKPPAARRCCRWRCSASAISPAPTC
jgi:hypothetical protein